MKLFFGTVGAIGLYFASTGFARNRSYGRAPAVLANLIAMGVAYYMISGDLLIVGVPLAIVGAVTFLCALFGYRENSKENY